MVSLEFLEDVEVFKGLSGSQLTAVQECCQKKEFKQDAKLFDEGESADHLWIVMEGRIDLRCELPGLASSEENTISSISAGGAIGWSCFVSPYKYRLSGYCASGQCELIRIEKEHIIRLFELDADVGYVVMSNMATVVGRRFNRLQDEIARLRGQHAMSGW